jgi:hypothetical protein
MKEADRLGIYVLFPGSGAKTGFVPREGWTTGQQCYCGWAGEPGSCVGKPLNFGRDIVRRTHYPNTLAVVIGNEFFLGPATFAAASVFKAYARDLKAYMKMCNDDSDSPSHGHMRQIPIMYAARDFGDEVDKEVMTYLKCGSADISIDIFGLNVERWCDPNTVDGYQSIHTMVETANLPGSFVFSEMGCPQNLINRAPPGQVCRTMAGLGQCCPRIWNQVPDFFEKHTMFDGFSAYAFWNDGAVNFNMFDNNSGDAAIFDDGRNFFLQTNQVKRAGRPMTSVQYPTCASQVNKQTVLPLEEMQAYDVDLYPARECPAGEHRRHAAPLMV